MSDMNVVRELAAHYAQLADDKDFAAFVDIMTPDFKQKGDGYQLHSRDEFIAVLEALRQFDRTLHLVGQSRGEWQRETYRGETWCVASHIYSKDGVERKMEMGIRYQEVIVRSEDRWKYRERNLNVVWTGDQPIHA